jgi:hypothetical protein
MELVKKIRLLDEEMGTKWLLVARYMNGGTTVHYVPLVRDACSYDYRNFPEFAVVVIEGGTHFLVGDMRGSITRDYVTAFPAHVDGKRAAVCICSVGDRAGNEELISQIEQAFPMYFRHNQTFYFPRSVLHS